MTIDFRSDPIGQRIKGWKAPPNSPKTRLVPGWEPRPEFGAGQEFDAGGLEREPIPPVITPLVPADREDRAAPFDWGAIRSAVFPEGLGAASGTPEQPYAPAPSAPPETMVPADRADRAAAARVAQPAANVYDPSQARTLSSSAPTPARPPAAPPAASRSAPAAGGPGGAGPALPRSQQDFISAMLPRAQAIAQRTGIDPTVMLAIAANETGWGTSKNAREQNNLFSIQGPAGRASRWATYESPEESFQAFANLISSADRYKKAWAVRGDPDAFVDELRKAGYVADEPGFPAQGWVNQVKSINRRLAPTDMSAASTSKSAAGGYVFPVSGYSTPVPDHWGEVKGGSDLFAKPGTPVLAMRGGKVVSAGFNKVGGNAVTIQGDDGLEYYYAHLIDTPTVRSGQDITAGTHLGGVGDTGNAQGKGAHLHIGIGPSIRAGSDKYGGTGGDYDAVGLLRAAQKGDPVALGNLSAGGTSGAASTDSTVARPAAPDRVRAPRGVARPEDLRRVVKYVDNENGTYTAHYEDGETAIEKTPSQLAPIEGGRHPRTVGAKPSSKRPGAGQEMFDPGTGGGEGPPAFSGGIFPSGEGRAPLGPQPGDAPMSAAATQPTPPPEPAPPRQTPVVRGGREDSYWTSEGTHGGQPAADIFAEAGTPIYSPVAGTVRPSLLKKGGNTAIIQGDDGKYYYMAHGNVPFTAGRVEADQPIGQVGQTGNAQYTDPHLHFAIASNPNLFDKYGGSGDVGGGPEYWAMGSGQEAAEPELDTYYHGTTAEFDKADPNTMFGTNLWGPGYYLTSDPTVAGGIVESGDPDDPEYNPTYAPGTVYKPGYSHKGMNIQRLFELQKQLEEDHNLVRHVQTMDPSIFSQWGSDRDTEVANARANLEYTNQQLRDLIGTQANVRQLGVPKDMKFFDMDTPNDDATVNAIADAMGFDMSQQSAAFKGVKGQDVYLQLWSELTDQGYGSDEAKDNINAALANAGYDGISHIGGARTGTPPHNVKVIFPESVPRIKNLLSGEWGGSDLISEIDRPKGHIPGQDVIDPVGHVPTPPIEDPVGHVPGAEPENPQGHVPGAEPEAPKGHVPGDDVPDPKKPDIQLPKLPDIQFPKLPDVQWPKLPGVPLPKLPGVPMPRLPGMPGLVGAGAEDDPDPDYSFLDTPLSTQGEARFQIWKAKYAPRDSGYDYDLRGAFKARIKPDPETGHWPDTYKKPNHPTFSDQSQFAKDYPDKAGRWDGETYVPPMGAGQMGAGDDWWNDTSQPALTEPELPWWEQAARVAQAGIGGAAQGVQEAVGGAVQGVQEAVGGATQAVQQGVGDVIAQATAPAVLQPGQRPAREEIAEIPGQVGEVFSGLGTAAREIVEEPEVKARRLAAGEEEDRKRKAQEELDRRRKITPEGVLPPTPLQIGPSPEEGEGFQPSPPSPTNPPVLGPQGMPLLATPKPGSPFDRAVRGEMIGQMAPGDQLAAVVEWDELRKKTMANAVPLEDPMLRDLVAMGLDPETYLLGGAGIGAARVVAAKTGSHLLGNVAAATVMEGPRLVSALQSGDPEQIATEAAIIAAGGVLPSLPRGALKVGGQVANAVSDIGPQMAKRLEQVTGPLTREGAALADALRPVTLTYSNSPLGQFLAAESGQATSRAALTLAAQGGGGAFIGGIAAAAPDLIHPDLDDPGWQARTWDDFWTGARYGGALGLGGGALGTISKYGWDKTFGPRVTRAFWAAVEPVRNIPSPYAQEAMIQRALNNGGARASAEVIEEEAYKLFGRGGQGLNTRDVAMYIEENGTLANYRGPNGERPTQKQIEWVEQRVFDEERLGNEQRAIGVLGKTQDVTTMLGDPGPTAHVMHTYDFEKNRKAVARGPHGLGWRGTVQRPRNKTTNPNVDPDTPITIREAMADHVAHPSERPMPTDSMTDRFVSSFRQQEEALANRRAWITISADKRVVWRPARGGRGAGLKAPNPPDDFVPVKEEWGLGRGSEGAYVHKDLADVYTNLTSVSPVGLRGAVSALRPVRELVFAGAVSHMFNVGWRTMLSTGPFKNAEIGTRAWKAFWNPNAREQFILNDPKLWIAAHEAGITPGAVTADIYGRASSLGGVAGQAVASTAASGLGGYAQAKLRGESDEEARWAAALWAGVAAGVSVPGPGALIARNERKGLAQEWHRSIIALSQEAVFDRALPLAKVTGWAALTKAGVAPGAAAEVMNNTIGGLNTAKMARAPWLQDLMRVGLMAPDWFESQIRQVGSLFVPGEVGAYSREVILKNAIAYGAFIESLNMAFNGHPTWENEPGYETTFETTGMLEKLGQITGKDLVQRHPESGVVQRTYADFLPNLRWVLNIAGEATRTGLEGYGTLMSATGNQGPGERLRGMARGNMAEGEVPPNLAGEVGNVISNRANQMFRVAGNLSAMAKGEQGNWTGRRYETPHVDENSTVWDKVLAVARATEGLAPAEIQQAQRTVNVLHPERSDWGDTIIESLLGLTRIGRTTEQGVRLRKKDDVLGFLNIQPRDAQMYEESYRSAVDQNSEKRSTLLNSLGPGGSLAQATHAKAAGELSDLAAARTHNSRRDQIERDYVAKTPDFLKEQVRTFLNNVYRVGDQGSANEADVPESIDLDAIWQRYWAPPDADPLNKDEMRRGQRRVLVESALELGVDSEALLDQIKWRAQNGTLSAQAPAMPALPGVTSGQFDVAIEQFLGAGVDPKTGIRIEDDDIRADLQRQALKDQAAQLGVDPQTLLRRINLRLSPASQLTTVEASYQTALQALYESYDADQFPRYMNEDGTPQGQREDWIRNDLIIGKEGMGRAKKLPELRELALAKERGQNARDTWLMENPSSTQFDRWFGTGRNMTEPQWREYAAGRTVGYDDLDLDADLRPPRDETIRRDKIQQLYRASNLDERLDTEVEVWAIGGYITMNLLAASRYLRHYMKNTAGRTLEYLAAHDELDPKARPALRAGSTVGAEQ